MALTTPQAAIQRAAIHGLPEYEDTGEMKDCAGFYTFRRYPITTSLADIVTEDGRPAVRCYLALIVDAPAPGSHVSTVLLKAWFALRWRFLRELATEEPEPGNPDAPSPQSAVLLARTRIPVGLDAEDAEGFIYDSREDAFFDPDGRVVTPAQMLDYMYRKHCRTLRRGFRIRWAVGSIARRAIRHVVWNVQDAAMWALLHCYDMELVPRKKEMGFDFFHKYKPSDFRRVTEKEGERSHFFGFQSSQRSFFTNLVAVAAVLLFLYWKGPHDGLVRVIYNNTALTTAALLLGFLLADDAISGAEYLKRPAYLRMMAALDPAPPFGALVIEEQSRLGRDTGRVLLAIQALEEAGVQIWTYQGGGSRISVADESGEVNATVVGLVDRMHRRQASTRRRVVARAKAEKGHVAGGVVFGYRNVRHVGHVVREIDADQAAVVRRIFAEIASGRGFIRVARGLTVDHVPSPRPGRGWGASSVRAVVFQDLYRGLAVYGRTRWQLRGGTKRKVRVPEAEWVRVAMPHLAVVTEAEWGAAHQRLDRTRQTYLRSTGGRLWGRPESGIESKWLLTGFLACAGCGGGMSATWSFDARHDRKPYYRCNVHRLRPERCANLHTVPLHALDQDVLQTLREDVLTPARIEHVIRRTLELHAGAPQETAAQREALRGSLRTLDRELAQLARAVAAAGSDIPVLVEALRATQRQRDEVTARLEHLDGLDRTVARWDHQDGLGAELRARLDQW